MGSLNLGQLDLRIDYGIVRGLLEVLDLLLQALPLRLAFRPLLLEYLEVLVLLIDLVQILVPFAKFLDLLRNLLFDGIVINLELDDPFVVFQGIPNRKAAFVLYDVVADRKGTQRRERRPDHFQELGRDVVAVQLAFRDVKVFETQGLRVLSEGLRDLDDAALDRVAFQDK